MSVFKSNVLMNHITNEVTEYTIACRILPNLYLETSRDIVLRHDHTRTQTVTSLEPPKSQRSLGDVFF